MSIATHLLLGIPEGLRVSNGFFHRLKARGQFGKGLAESIGTGRRLGRRTVDTTEEPPAQGKE
jgi:hypothetical protein